MAKPEASLWDYLRTVLPSQGHYSRIESLETSPGFPDVHYSLLGYTGSIELKSGKAPFKKKGLRKSQVDWMAEEDIAHGVIWIIAEVKKSIFLIDGNIHFEEFNQMDESRLFEVADYTWVRGEEEPTDELHRLLATER